jgi:hypothetical protein
MADFSVHDSRSESQATLPWRLGQGAMDALVDYARDAREPFRVDVRRGVYRASIGERLAGLLNPKTLDFYKWPSVREPMTDARAAAYLHAVADKDDTFAKCYFIGGETGPVKIGYSVDVQSRFRVIQLCCPTPLRVMAVCEGGEAREAAYHTQFSAHRLHGEWFSRAPDIFAEIARLSPCDGGGE